MKQRSFRTVAAVMIAAAALALGACSTSDSKSDAKASTTTSAAAKAADTFEDGNKDGKAEGEAPSKTPAPDLPKPTVQQLNDKLTKAFDPSIDGKEKISWIENAERDPLLVEKLVDAAKKNKVKVEVTKVGDPKDGKLKADAKVTIDGSPVDNATIDFVAEGDQWKVANQFACSIVKSAKLDSAACQS
ncbi:hypothetical protein [Nocardia sp. NPDC052566]|uniref:hypothetical protein n=1 Tax=Nocardia sp. NPDC052566 TaxID=3364330 RepID=UPI0037C687EA